MLECIRKHYAKFDEIFEQLKIQLLKNVIQNI